MEIKEQKPITTLQTQPNQTYSTTGYKQQFYNSNKHANNKNKQTYLHITDSVLNPNQNRPQHSNKQSIKHTLQIFKSPHTTSKSSLPKLHKYRKLKPNLNL